MASPNIPVMQIEQVDCTMVRALSMALPGNLDDLGDVLKLNAKKDKEGSALMKSMCKPRKARKGEWKDNVYWIDDAASVDRLHDYCDQDISTEIAAGKKVHRLKPQELKYWHLDQRMNDRGFAVDLVSARKLMAIAEIATLRANAKMVILTKGEVTAVSQAGAIAAWIDKKGIPCKSIAKGEIESVLKEAYFWGHQAAIDVLELRQTAAKSSVAKITTLHKCVCDDGRVRGSIQFYGAAITGRDAGRLFQPQNLPRADADKDLPSVWKVYEILEECGNNVIQAYDRIEKEIGPPMIWISKAIRSLIVAGPGKKLIGGDLSNIEGRGAQWLAGDEEGLEKFRKIDAGLLPDVYVLAYSEAFGVLVAEVTAEQRSLGKIITLACGFQGGIGAFVRFATEKLLKSMVKTVKAAVSDEVWEAAWERFATRRDRCDLTRDQWTAIRITVDAWRKANSKIVQLWYDLEKAAIDAVENPRKPFSVAGGKIIYVFQNGFLWCRLPSGRALAYFNPAVATVGDMVVKCLDGIVRPVDDVATDELLALKEQGIEPYETKGKKRVEFEGYAQRAKGEKQVESERYAQRAKGGGKIWVRRVKGNRNNLSLYGGRQLENCLAKDTEVLTDSGWKNILGVTLEDKLWDGESWVSHDGLIYQGVRETHKFGGVGMTHDHKIWTRDGWIESKDTNYEEAKAASPCGRSGRPEIRLSDGDLLCGLKREEVTLEREVCLRYGDDVRSSEFHEPVREEVFDLVNAGPNHRFTVRAPGGGEPFIVSNCDQAMCRDIMFHAAQLADESGMDLVLRVHDELLCEAPDGNDEFYRELLRKCLTTNPHWLPGFPLAAKCFASLRYVH